MLDLVCTKYCRIFAICGTTVKFSIMDIYTSVNFTKFTVYVKWVKMAVFYTLLARKFVTYFSDSVNILLQMPLIYVYFILLFSQQTSSVND